MTFNKLLIAILQCALMFFISNYASAAATSTSCVGIATWNASTAYAAPGTSVVYKGIKYKSNWWTQNDQPDINNGDQRSGQPWRVLRGCDSPVPAASATPSPEGAVVFSPYKDVGINANWNTLVMSTVVNSASLAPLLSALPSNIKTVTWAFATGECGQENWAGMGAEQFAKANVSPYVTAGKNYIISTGGAAGIFTCSSNAGMHAFLNRYMSVNLIGLDVDIERDQTQDQITSLVKTLVYAKSLHPNLRISFTLATLADSSGGHAGLNELGNRVITTAKAAGLDFYVNLMVMDYGTTSAYTCVLSGSLCQMALSAEQAVINLQSTYAIAANRIEVTPMIGNNDISDEVFTIADAEKLASFVVINKLAGYHFWSLDRDTPCVSGSGSLASSTCNSASGATPFGFSKIIAPYFP